MDSRIRQFYVALMDAFTVDELDHLLRFGLDKKLDDISSTDAAKPKVFLNVVDSAIANGWLLQLAQAAFMERSANEKIRAFYADHVEPSFRNDQPRAGRFTPPYFDTSTSSMDIGDRIRELEILFRGIDGYNGVLSRMADMERRITILIILQAAQIAAGILIYAGS